jgi:hypothetical protein
MAKRKWNWGGRGEQDWRPKSKKVVLYSREFENKAGELQPDGKRVLALDTVKFASLLRLLDEHRGGEAESVLVALPEVLGDTYEEVIMRLEVIAEAGMSLLIVPMSNRTGDKMQRVDVDEEMGDGGDDGDDDDDDDDDGEGWKKA